MLQKKKNKQKEWHPANKPLLIIFTHWYKARNIAPFHQC
jgi:hypothetical protein